MATETKYDTDKEYYVCISGEELNKLVKLLESRKELDIKNYKKSAKDTERQDKLKCLLANGKKLTQREQEFLERVAREPIKEVDIPWEVKGVKPIA